MRNPAIPALTRGWLSAPARRRLVDAARTRPPAVSAVTRLRSGADGRPFLRGMRSCAPGRTRILAGCGAAFASLRPNFASISRAGTGRACATGFGSGTGVAGFGDTDACGLDAGADAGFLAGGAAAGFGGGTGVLTAAFEGVGIVSGRAEGARGTLETSGFSSLRNSSSLSSTEW